MTLLGDIEAAAMDSKVPIADLLRKCKKLAAHLKHKEFADWVNHELSGYPRGVDVPVYRQLGTPLSIGHFIGGMGSSMSNVPIPIMGLPESIQKILKTYEAREPARQLEEFAANDKQGLHLKWQADIVNYVSTHHPMIERMQLMDASRTLSPGTIAGVVDNIRSRILDFVLAIQTQDPSAGEAPLNAPPPVQPSTVNQVFNTTIIGGQANIANSGDATIAGNVAKGTQTAGDVSEPSDLLPLLMQLREEAKNEPDEENREEALATIEKMEKHAKAPREKFNVDKMQKYLALYSSLVTAASTTIPQLEHGLVVLRHWLGV